MSSMKQRVVETYTDRQSNQSEIKETPLKCSLLEIGLLEKQADDK
jgi:hypothetical protein